MYETAFYWSLFCSTDSKSVPSPQFGSQTHVVVTIILSKNPLREVRVWPKYHFVSGCLYFSYASGLRAVGKYNLIEMGL